MTMRPYLMVGGPKNGEFISTDMKHRLDIYYEEAPPDLFCQYPDQEPVSVRRGRRHLYEFKKIACPDRWVEEVLVHESVDIMGFDELHLIKFVMDSWRARKGK